MKQGINTGLIFAVILLSINGCTDLGESVYSELNEDNFYNNRTEVMQAALRPMTHMKAWLAPTGQNGHYYHSALSADLVAWPQKGRHGYDAGDHIRQHYHTWTTEENRLNGAWELMWSGVGYVNSALEDLEGLNYDELNISDEERETIISELKVLRAFHYMKIMDMWGNVPIITSDGEPIDPETKPREEVFQFVKEELEDNVENLRPLSQERVARVSKAAGYAMLSELYLNAEVWNGTPMWDEAIEVSDKIINGEGGSLTGGLELDLNPLGPFSNTNDESPENLMQLAYSREAGEEFNWSGFYFGYDYMAEALNVTYEGWNAFVVVPSAFDMYKENDKRKEEWFLFGPQYKYGTDEPVLGTEEYEGEPLEFVNSIRRNSEGATGEGGMTEGEENSGPRFHKYRSGTKDDPNYWENDYVIYRLTEIYFNKAEALMRKNGGTATQEAVGLINESKKRYFTESEWADEKYDMSSLTLDELQKERGREFIFEGKRRTTLIRFDKFTNESWWDHEPSNDKHLELYPIPRVQTASNPNLEQNQGYSD